MNCSECGGTGRSITTKGVIGLKCDCPTCKGTGKVLEKKAVEWVSVDAVDWWLNRMTYSPEQKKRAVKDLRDYDRDHGHERQPCQRCKSDMFLWWVCEHCGHRKSTEG